MTDERPESLAAQAASWVPPWERAQRPPDPAYAAAHREPVGEEDGELAVEPGLDDDGEAAVEPGLDDDGEPAVEPDLDGDGEPADGGDEVPPELPPVPGEATGPATVDAPQ